MAIQSMGKLFEVIENTLAPVVDEFGQVAKMQRSLLIILVLLAKSYHREKKVAHDFYHLPVTVSLDENIFFHLRVCSWPQFYNQELSKSKGIIESRVTLQ